PGGVARHPGVALLLLQEPDGEGRPLPRARPLHPVDEAEEHAPRPRRRGAADAPRPRLLPGRPARRPEITLRVDSRDRFSATVDLYKKYRPSYPPALIDWLLEVGQLAPGDRVADLGCGTGISTRLLAARGLDVVGIDPNEDMLASARAEGGVATYQRGEAVATGLANASVKMATAAQAFHWFD